MVGWVLKMKLMLTQLSTKLELKLKLKLSLAKMKNDLHAIKRIPYDIGHLTVYRGLRGSNLPSDHDPS